MLNNSPLYQKQDMIIRDEDYCRKNGLMGLSDKQLRAYPNAWRSWPRNYGGNYGDGSDLPLWNGLARSLNKMCIRDSLNGAKQLCHSGAAAKHGGAARGRRRAQPAGADGGHSHFAGG